MEICWQARVRTPLHALAMVGLAVLIGCNAGRRVGPTMVANSDLGPMTIAVAPALNQSGSADFDPNRFADLMASELSYGKGITVIPVSRVLAVLASQGRSGIESPAHALEIVGSLGVDALLVFSVTEYAPYDPPIIGITAQLYGQRPGHGGGTADPVALARKSALVSTNGRRTPRGLVAQTHGVFDASHEFVVDDIRGFASRRGGDASPYGWRKFVVSQQHFIRYCCFATIRSLLNRQDRIELADGDPREVRMP